MIKGSVEQGVVILNLHVINKRQYGFWKYRLNTKRNRKIPHLMDLKTDHWNQQQLDSEHAWNIHANCHKVRLNKF